MTTVCASAGAFACSPNAALVGTVIAGAGGGGRDLCPLQIAIDWIAIAWDIDPEVLAALPYTGMCFVMSRKTNRIRLMNDKSTQKG